MGRHADRLVIIGGIELGAIAAPGRILQDAVDLTKARRGKAKRNDLSDAHHHIPAHDLGARRWKGFVVTLLLKLRVQLVQWARLVVLEKYRQENGVISGRPRVLRRGCGRLRRCW